MIDWFLLFIYLKYCNFLSDAVASKEFFFDEYLSPFVTASLLTFNILLQFPQKL